MGPRLRGDDAEGVVTTFDSIRRSTTSSHHATVTSVALIRAKTTVFAARSVAALCTGRRAGHYRNNVAFVTRLKSLRFRSAQFELHSII